MKKTIAQRFIGANNKVKAQREEKEELPKGSFPTYITYQGKKYISTGKKWTDLKTGNLCVNYKTVAEYLWLDSEGNIIPDGL